MAATDNPELKRVAETVRTMPQARREDLTPRRQCLTVVIGALLLSSSKDMRIFGLLAAAVLAITYSFFAYAYVSIFCFGAAVISLYLIRVVQGPVMMSADRSSDPPRGSSAARTRQ